MKRIMIVDDSLMARMNLKKLLEKNGYEVIAEACNGEEAIKKYAECLPELTTLDITMPVLDGITALKEIRKIDVKARVIMISALGQEHKIVESLNSGASHYIQKPFKDQHALNIIQSVLSAETEDVINDHDAG